MKGRIILGPCPCQGCRENVWWCFWTDRAAGLYRVGWRDHLGVHACPAR